MGVLTSAELNVIKKKWMKKYPDKPIEWYDRMVTLVALVNLGREGAK